MAKSNRRQFLKQSGAGVAGLAVLGCRTPESGVAIKASARPIPPHRPLRVQGVHGYSDPISVEAGREIRLHVSSDRAYELTICRLGSDVDSPSKDEPLHRFGERPPQVQPIHPGSYIRVEKAIEGRLDAFTLECWVRPWKIEGTAGLLSQMGRFYWTLDSTGNIAFGERLDSRGGPVSAVQFGNPALAQGQWHHLVLVRRPEGLRLYVNGDFAASRPLASAESASVPDAALMLGAVEGPNGAEQFLDGDLAMPVIYKRPLSAGEIKARYESKALVPPPLADVWFCLPLDEEGGEAIRDLSPYQRDGRLINHGTWMIGGPSFDADVPRFGDYDPKSDPRRGHGLRLASDDLYDCRWKPTHRFKIPHSWTPGVYVGRMRFDWEGQEALRDMTFIVRRSQRRPKARVLVLCSTNTWLAYSGTSFGKNSPAIKQAWGTGGIENGEGDPPAFNLYRPHRAGQGTYQMGMRMPWPAAGPYALYGGKTDYSHLTRADRCLHAWLEKEGYSFDVVSDLDLHRDPDLLKDYQVFLINGHSEYWSLPAYHGLERYLENGGNVVCLSGNSLFWRVSFDERDGIMECRKADAPGNQMAPEFRGECWHSHDGLRGGLLRECGYPGWKLIGLETLGWIDHNRSEMFGPYKVGAAHHALFNEPEPTGVQDGDAIGLNSQGGLPMANGHEIDVRLSTLARIQERPNPEGVRMPQDPDGMTLLAAGVIPWRIGGSAFDYFFRPIKPAEPIGGEMIFWERPGGGKVFNSGSIGTGWALLVDPGLQGLLRNVLSRFGVSLG